jgi:phthalate 4,5-dioxygenase
VRTSHRAARASPNRALTAKEIEAYRNGAGIHAQKIPGTFRPVRNKSNDYSIDRDLQRSGRSYTGIVGPLIRAPLQTRG